MAKAHQIVSFYALLPVRARFELFGSELVNAFFIGAARKSQDM